MRFRLMPVIVTGLLFLCTSLPVTRAAAAASSEEQVAGALTAWRSGDLTGAHDLLTQMIDRGTADSRVWFYRGLLAEQMGEDGTADFEAGARHEVDTGETRLVNQALERVQGFQRGRIERFRAEARTAVKPDPRAARQALRFRDAMTAMNNHDPATAAAMLSEVIAESPRDPRFYYLKGVVDAQLGNMDLAKAMFQEGMNRESSAEDVRLVNRMLEPIPGDLRQIIEEQVLVTRGATTVSRKEIARNLYQEERLLQDRLMAAGEAARGQLLADADAARLQREQDAAAAFLKSEQMAREKADLIASAVPEAPVTPVAPTSPAEKGTAPAAPNPFGATIGTPPAANTAPATGNGFAFSTDAPPAPRSGSASDALNTGWLAPETELVIQLRPGNILTSGFMAPLMELPQVGPQMQMIAGVAGINPSDIDSVTIGASNVMTVIMGTVMQAGGGGPPDGGAIVNTLLQNPGVIGVIRTRTDFSPANLMLMVQATTQSHEGRDYYQFTPPGDGAPELAVYAADSKTILIGSVVAVQAAMTRGAGKDTLATFGFVPPGNDLVLAFSSAQLAAMSGALIPTPPDGSPASAVEFVDAIRGKLSGVALVAQADVDLTSGYVLNLTDAEAAVAATAAMQKQLGEGRDTLDVSIAALPPELKEMATTVYEGTHVTAAGSQVSVISVIPGKYVRTLRDRPELLQQAFQGMMQPGGNPGGGFGPPGLGDPSSGFGNPGTPAENPNQ